MNFLKIFFNFNQYHFDDLQRFAHLFQEAINLQF
jgi:hypothetical protein